MEGEWRGSCTAFVHFLVDGRWEIAGDDDMVMVGNGVVGNGVVGVELGCGVGVWGWGVCDGKRSELMGDRWEIDGRSGDRWEMMGEWGMVGGWQIDGRSIGD